VEAQRSRPTVVTKKAFKTRQDGTGLGAGLLDHVMDSRFMLHSTQGSCPLWPQHGMASAAVKAVCCQPQHGSNMQLQTGAAEDIPGLVIVV
jgi:hypothetical protein